VYGLAEQMVSFRCGRGRREHVLGLVRKVSGTGQDFQNWQANEKTKSFDFKAHLYPLVDRIIFASLLQMHFFFLNFYQKEVSKHSDKYSLPSGSYAPGYTNKRRSIPGSIHLSHSTLTWNRILWFILHNYPKTCIALSSVVSDH